MATSDGPLSVSNVTMQLARGGAAAGGGGGGGDPAVGFIAESGFSLLDNEDGTLTVTDSQARLGTKPNGAKPVWFFDFASGSDQPHPTLSRQQKTVIWQPACFITTSITKSGSTHSMVIDKETDGENPIFVADGGLSGDKILQLPSNTGRKYYRYHDFYNAFTFSELQTQRSDFNEKSTRWQHDTAQDGTTNGPLTLCGFQGATKRFEFAGDSLGTYDSTLYNGNSELTTEKWRVEEEYHEVSSGTAVEDAVMYGILHGKKIFTRSNIDSHKGFDPAVYQWDHFKFFNFNKWAPQGTCPYHSNILYVDDSWCRVYITDKPDWNETETRELEIQVPVGWDGDVTFSFRPGIFSDLAGKYLWIADNDDTKILVGGWS